MTISKIKINSFCTSVLICANPLTWNFTFIPNILVVILLLVGGVSLVVNKKISILIGGIFTFVLILYLLDLLHDPTNKYLILYFGFFVIAGGVGITLSQYSISYELIYKYTALISIILIPTICNMDFGDPEYESVDYGHWMGVSYGILRLVVGLILCLFLSYYSKKIKILSAMALLFYFYICLIYGSRGIFIALLIFALFFYIINSNLSSNKLIRLVLICGGILVLLLLYIQPIMLGLYNILSNLNVHILFLEKTIRMFLEDSISNGRDELVMDALVGAKESPFWGNGIASFEAIYDRYPHNLFLQAFYEKGFIFLLPIMFVFIYSICFMMNNKQDKQKRIFMCFLFVSGVVELLFSSVFWKSQIFWFYIGYTILTLRKSLNNENSIAKL